MISILHLVDDAAMGGVNRTLDDQRILMGDVFRIEQEHVNPRRPWPLRPGEDVVVVHFTSSWAKLPFLTLLRAQRGDKPIVLVEHTYTRCFETNCVTNHKRFRRMLSLTYRLADVVVAVSDGQADWMREAKLLPDEKLVVIRPAVDLAKFFAAEVASRSDGGPLRLGAYGRYCEQKAFEVLISAMRLLPADRFTLSLAGYGADRAMLEQRAEGMTNVRIAGPTTNPSKFVEGCDVIVIPSRWEAFGNVAAEARAAGRPVIACAVDGLSEQISPDYGWLVPAEDPEALADAIKCAADQDVGRMGRAARLSARGHTTDYLRKWTTLLNGLSAPLELAQRRAKAA
ncbi:MAG: glycosyltransferase family 4 protein [Hyphomicrobiaceae bacterium]